MLLPYTLLSAILFLCSLLPTPIYGAFSIPVTSGNDTSVIEQNSAETWCYYPAPRANRTIPLDHDCTGANADFRAVMAVHLEQTASISYYNAGLDRLGGPEYPVRTSPGKTYLCISGRATDGLYETSCEQATRDNQFGRGPFGNRTICAVGVSQAAVSDGCYAPGDASPQNESGGSGSGSNSAAAEISYRADLLLILFAAVVALNIPL
ncbi:hypothetical protein EST38_g203 [Candolleomyces aberdarensis]|uniref:Uncharacterized protein n=1 Tax=Candolleomyces aberdarensis TaxID=2316362 RepID=A0A4Q2E0L7_9AGAR|nr:hypothetical protein EST38_g203 [Candolleomyces aberdarensis]